MAHFLKCKDHTVSQEEFNLEWNKEKDILITSPVPAVLDSYYESEDYISHTDTKRNLLEIVYQSVKSVSLKRKLKLIDSFVTYEKSLLDVGCGTGDFLKLASEEGWKVHGIEPNEKAATLAIRKGIMVNEVSALQDLKDEQVDVITLWHVLEHLPDLEQDITRFHELLKPEGILIIAVPNFNSWDANYYKQHWAAFDVPRHLWHFSQKGIKRLLGEHNFKHLKTLPMKFDAYYVCLLSEKIKNGKSNWFKAFFNGWRSNRKARTTSDYSSLIYCFQKA
jgi:2-polyprenyl-3-methyl-5-hydroxy-6-metoxy-1,4-benzoquinol methylase